MAFAATLFDYNGILIDDERVHLDAFREALRGQGVSVSDGDYFERYIGFDDVGGFAAMLEDAGKEHPPELIAELVERKKHIYLARARQGLSGYGGAAELLERRSKVGPIAIVSGALHDEIELGLEFLNVRQRVGKVIAAEDTSNSKPNPEGYLLGLAWLRTQVDIPNPNRVLVFEDTVAGVQAAKAAGLSCIGVGHTGSVATLEKAGADASCQRLTDIDDVWLADLAASMT